MTGWYFSLLSIIYMSLQIYSDSIIESARCIITPTKEFALFHINATQLQPKPQEHNRPQTTTPYSEQISFKVSNLVFLKQLI